MGSRYWAQVPCVVLGAALCSAPKAQAEAGFVVLETALNSPLSIAISQGHAAIYLPTLCHENHLKLRWCAEGERTGVIINRNSGISKENYDWLVTTPSTFFYGVDDPEKTPLFANKKIAQLVKSESFRSQNFAAAIAVDDKGMPPEGKWSDSIANSYDRDSYVFRLKTTREQEQNVMDAFNAFENVSKFKLRTENCADLPEHVFKILFPERRQFSKIPGLGMATPKGLAMDIVGYAQQHPEAELQIDKLAQLPGTFRRSVDNHFPLENLYKNFYGGLVAGFQKRPYALVGTGAMHVVAFTGVGAIVFHQFLAHFAIPDEYLKYLNPRIRTLVQELGETRYEQDRVRLEMQHASAGGDSRQFLEAIQRGKEVHIKLQTLKRQIKIEQERALGGEEEWESYKTNFRSLLRGLRLRSELPVELRGLLADSDDPGAISKRLLKFFEDAGTFSERNGDLEMSLQFREEDSPRACGLTSATVLTQDALLGTLALLAHTGSVLDAKRKNSELMEPFQNHWNLLILSAARMQ